MSLGESVNAVLYEPNDEHETDGDHIDTADDSDTVKTELDDQNDAV